MPFDANGRYTPPGGWLKPQKTKKEQEEELLLEMQRMAGTGDTSQPPFNLNDFSKQVQQSQVPQFNTFNTVSALDQFKVPQEPTVPSAQDIGLQSQPVVQPNIKIPSPFDLVTQRPNIQVPTPAGDASQPVVNPDQMSAKDHAEQWWDQNPATRTIRDSVVKPFTFLVDTVFNNNKAGKTVQRFGQTATEKMTGVEMPDQYQVETGDPNLDKLADMAGNAGYLIGGPGSGGTSIVNAADNLAAKVLPKFSSNVAANGALKATTGLEKTAFEKGLGQFAKASAIGSGVDMFKGATTPDMEDRNLGEKFGSSMTAGGGDTVDLMGSTAKWLGFENLGNDMQEFGKASREGYEIDREEFGWQSMFDPNFYAVNVARSLPISLSLMPLGLAGGAAGGAAAGAAGLGTFGRTVFTAAGASMFATPLEAAMEAGGVYEEMRKTGKPAEEANSAANKTFWKNMAILGASNMVEFGAMFAPKGALGGLADNGSVRIGSAAASGMAEEAGQEWASRSSKGEKFAFDAETLESMAIGGMMGFGFGAVGHINESHDPVQTIWSKTKERLPEDVKVDIDAAMEDAKAQGISETEALRKIQDAIAEDPELAAHIGEATKEVIESARMAEVNKAPANVDEIVKPEQPQAESAPNIGDFGIPTSADGTHMSEARKIIDVQNHEGKNYYRFEGFDTFFPQEQVIRQQSEAKQPQAQRKSKQEEIDEAHKFIDQFFSADSPEHQAWSSLLEPADKDATREIKNDISLANEAGHIDKFKNRDLVDLADDPNSLDTIRAELDQAKPKAPAAEPKVGDTVTVRGFGDQKFTVTGTAGKDMFKLQSEKGGVMSSIHKKSLTPISDGSAPAAAPQEAPAAQAPTAAPAFPYERGSRVTVDGNPYEIQDVNEDQVTIRRDYKDGTIHKRDERTVTTGELQQHGNQPGMLTDRREWYRDHAKNLSRDELRSRLSTLPLEELQGIANDLQISGHSKLPKKKEAYVDFLTHNLRRAQGLEERQVKEKEVDHQARHENNLDSIRKNVTEPQAKQIEQQLERFQSGNGNLRIDDVSMPRVAKGEDKGTDLVEVNFTDVDTGKTGTILFDPKGNRWDGDLMALKKDKKQLASFEWDDRTPKYAADPDYTGLMGGERTDEKRAAALRDKVQAVKDQNALKRVADASYGGDMKRAAEALKETEARNAKIKADLGVDSFLTENILEYKDVLANYKMGDRVVYATAAEFDEKGNAKKYGKAEFIVYAYRQTDWDNPKSETVAGMNRDPKISGNKWTQYRNVGGGYGYEFDRILSVEKTDSFNVLKFGEVVKYNGMEWRVQLQYGDTVLLWRANGKKSGSGHDNAIVSLKDDLKRDQTPAEQPKADWEVEAEKTRERTEQNRLRYIEEAKAMSDDEILDELAVRFVGRPQPGYDFDVWKKRVRDTWGGSGNDHASMSYYNKGKIVETVDGRQIKTTWDSMFKRGWDLQAAASAESQVETDVVEAIEAAHAELPEKKFNMLAFAVSPRTAEMEAIRRTQPDSILVSFAAWRPASKAPKSGDRKATLREFINSFPEGYKPNIILDSGAPSFHGKGKYVGPENMKGIYGNDWQDVFDMYHEQEDEEGLTPLQVINHMRYDMYALDNSLDDDAYEYDENGDPIRRKKKSVAGLEDFMQYIEFIQDHKDVLTHYMNMDTIGNQELSNFSFEVMEEIGMIPIPVYSFGSEIRALDKLVNTGYDYIALGGTAVKQADGKKLTQEQRVEWVRSLLERHPKVKFHLLGTNDQKVLDALPGLYSADGTTWITAAGAKAKGKGLEVKTEKAVEEIQQREEKALGKKPVRYVEVPGAGSIGFREFATREAFAEEIGKRSGNTEYGNNATAFADPNKMEILSAPGADDTVLAHEVGHLFLSKHPKTFTMSLTKEWRAVSKIRRKEQWDNLESAQKDMREGKSVRIAIPSGNTSISVQQFAGYLNNPHEMFADAFSYYMTDPEKAAELMPQTIAILQPILGDFSLSTIKGIAASESTEPVMTEEKATDTQPLTQEEAKVAYDEMRMHMTKNGGSWKPNTVIKYLEKMKAFAAENGLEFNDYLQDRLDQFLAVRAAEEAKNKAADERKAEHDKRLNEWQAALDEKTARFIEFAKNFPHVDAMLKGVEYGDKYVMLDGEKFEYHDYNLKGESYIRRAYRKAREEMAKSEGRETYFLPGDKGIYHLGSGHDEVEIVEAHADGDVKIRFASGKESLVSGERVERTSASTIEQETMLPVSNDKVIVFGKESTVMTERGNEIQTHFALVDSNDLIVSHSIDFRENPDYPSEIQPRDRSRQGMQDQVRKMAASIRPTMLGDSPKASDGAPIVGPDLVVESGNGRTIALQMAYEQRGSSMKAYRDFLVTLAEKFGFTQEQVRDAFRGGSTPILVRVRDTQVDRVAFANEANESAVAAMSATEQATSDAQKLTGALLAQFNPGEDGNILAFQNNAFVRDFVGQVIGPNDRARFMDKNGQLNQDGVTRIRNAVFAKAYGNTAAIERLAESTDDNIRNITNAMLQAAPTLVEVQTGIEKGALHPLDITGDVAAAAEKLSEIRDNGQTVEFYLNQGDIFGGELSDEGKNLLALFNANKRSTKKIASVLRTFAEVVEALGSPNQVSLFGNETAPTKLEALEAAIRKVEGEDGQIALWSDEKESSGSAAAQDQATRPQKESDVDVQPVQAEEVIQIVKLTDVKAGERVMISSGGLAPYEATGETKTYRDDTDYGFRNLLDDYQGTRFYGNGHERTGFRLISFKRKSKERIEDLSKGEMIQEAYDAIMAKVPGLAAKLKAANKTQAIGIFKDAINGLGLFDGELFVGGIYEGGPDKQTALYIRPKNRFLPEKISNFQKLLNQYFHKTEPVDDSIKPAVKYDDEVVVIDKNGERLDGIYKGMPSDKVAHVQFHGEAKPAVIEPSRIEGFFEKKEQPAKKEFDRNSPNDPHFEDNERIRVIDTNTGDVVVEGSYYGDIQGLLFVTADDGERVTVAFKDGHYRAESLDNPGREWVHGEQQSAIGYYDGVRMLKHAIRRDRSIKASIENNPSLSAEELYRALHSDLLDHAVDVYETMEERAKGFKNFEDQSVRVMSEASDGNLLKDIFEEWVKAVRSPKTKSLRDVDLHYGDHVTTGKRSGTIVGFFDIPGYTKRRGAFVKGDTGGTFTFDLRGLEETDQNQPEEQRPGWTVRVNDSVSLFEEKEQKYKADSSAHKRSDKQFFVTDASDPDKLTVQEVLKGGKLGPEQTIDRYLVETRYAGEETPNESTESVGQDGAETLEGTPAENVPGSADVRETGTSRVPGAGEDRASDGGSNGEGSISSGSVGASEGELDTASGRGNDAEPVNVPKAAASKVTNYSIPKNADLGLKGKKTSYEDNVAAIKLMKKIMAEGRAATPKEQAILVKYVGWGGIAEPFSPAWQIPAAWKSEHAELKELLTKDEWEFVADTILNAHYTSRDVIQGMYKGLQQLGFTSGRVLEPGMGIGHFIGFKPAAVNAKFTGIEIDPITGNIAKLLYPASDIRVQGFQEAKLADDFYDAVIGNVPFGNITIFDPAYEKKGLTKAIHNYFFAKSIDKVRPGGVMMLVTSRYTMDAEDSKTRKYLASKADLIGAIRLPNTAFKENAGTEVVTDILILQKRQAGKAPADTSWLESKTMRVGDRGFVINQYFQEHPEMILGEPSADGKMYRGDGYTVNPTSDNLQEQIAKVMKKLPKNIIPKREHKATEKPEPREMIPAPGHVKENAFHFVNDKLYIKEDGQSVPIDLPKATQERIKGLIGVRDALRDYFKHQMNNAPESTITASRKRLNQVYDAFVKKYEPINSTGNVRAFQTDPDFYLLTALEKYDPKTKKAEKADVFSKRTIQAYQPVDKVDRADDALVVALQESGRVDMQRMAQLTGLTEDQLVAELPGRIYRDPISGWVTADDYLSGNVRAKLAEAENAADLDPVYQENVEALKAVQPVDLTEKEISVRLGAGWIPTDYMRDFAAYILDIRPDSITVGYNAQIAEWSLDIPNADTRRRAKNGTNSTVKWGTTSVNALKLLDKALNSGNVQVTFKDGDGKTQKDVKATLAARAKLEEMKAEFITWLWKDEQRKKSLTDYYNQTFNTERLREYDGSHLTFPGMTPAIQLKEHQKAAVWRAIQNPNTLLAHAVGAGKTFEMIASMMELKRMGIIKKPMWVVPNHLVEQMGQDFMKLYPSANIMVATKNDFASKKRQALMARIATGEFDAVIVAHSSFGFIPLSVERARSFFTAQLDHLELAIQQDVNNGRRSDTGLAKKIRKARKSLETKMQKQLARLKKDQAVDFEEMGIDAIVVDEAHEFKNLFYFTNNDRVGGLGDPEGAGKAFDLLAKIQYIQETGGRTIFATGTPIANSMAEMFTLLRYLAPNELSSRSMSHFDAWAAVFGDLGKELELAPEGRGYRIKEKFKNFTNVAELKKLFRKFADVRMADELLAAGLITRPELKGGKREVVIVPASDELTNYVTELGERADAVRQSKVDKEVDNMLKIVSDGRKAALDMRLVDPSLPEDPQSKVNIAVDNMFKIYKETTGVYAEGTGKDGKPVKVSKGTQLVFLDLSTPKGEKTDKDGNVIQDESMDAQDVGIYDELRKKLIKKGVPASEISFIHDAKTDAQKFELYDKVNEGKTRFLIGSTFKMGAGMNVQERLVALHHMDVPWRPADIEQREGRILRQGNFNPEVQIYTYNTEGSFDAYMWQVIANKAAMIETAMNNDMSIRSMKDFSDSTLSAREAMALASGDMRIMELENLRVEVDTLDNKRQSLAEAEYSMEWKLDYLPANRAKNQERYDAYKATQDALKPVDGDKFTMTVNKNTFTDRKEAGQALMKLVAHLKSAKGKDGAYKVGNYAGLEIALVRESTDLLEEPMVKGHLIGKADIELSFAAQAESETGMIRSLDAAIGHVDTNMKYYADEIAHLDSEKAKLTQEIVSTKAERKKVQTELAEKTVRRDELAEELNMDRQEEQILDDANDSEDGPTLEDVEAESADRVSRAKANDNVGIVPAFLQSKKSSRKSPHAYLDPELESIHQSATIPKETWLQKTRKFKDEFVKRATREFVHLPKTPEFQPLRSKLLQLLHSRGVAADTVNRNLLQSIVLKLDRDRYDLFVRKVMLDDFQEESEMGNALPNGFTPEKLEKEKAVIDAKVAADPFVKEAIGQRNKIWKGIKNSYIKAMDDIGEDVGDRFRREYYFRHQVIAHYGVEDYQIGNDPTKVQTPNKRGFLKGRSGSFTGIINRDYLQSDFEVMTQMLYDIEKAKVLKMVDGTYNIQKQLKADAKKMNADEIQKIIDAEIASKKYLRLEKKDPNVQVMFEFMEKKIPYSPTQDMLKSFNIKQAIAYSNLSKMDPQVLWMGENDEYADVVQYLTNGKVKADANLMYTIDPDFDRSEVMAYFSELAKRTDEPGVIQARTILKAIANKRTFIENALGGKFKNGGKLMEWDDIIPDGHVVWQPDPGNHFYIASTVDLDRLVQDISAGVIESMGGLAEFEEYVRTRLSQDQMVMGSKKPEFVVPAEVAATLTEIAKQENKGFVFKALQSAMSIMKVQMLVGPTRVIKYNLRNMTSDIEKTFAGNPKALFKFARAAKELAPVILRESGMKGDLKEWFQRGGMQTLLQVNEMGDINELKMFVRLAEKSAVNPVKLWTQYWRIARKYTDFREAILRYANYLEYLEQIQKTGKPANYGSSKPELIDALHDPKDKAFKLANELLVDYSATSKFGQELASAYVPFFRWIEGNMKSTIQLMKNAAYDEKLAGAVGRKLLGKAVARSPYLAYRAGSLALKVSLLTILLQLWNHLLFDDEEDELPEDVKKSLHIIYGRDENGKIRYFDRLGAIEDFLGWFGLDDGISDVRDILEGKKTVGEVAGDNLKAIANKAVNTYNPINKLVGETVRGTKSFPDAFNEGKIKDQWEHLAAFFGLRNEYKAVKNELDGTAGPSYDWQNLLNSGSHPGEAAYYDILAEKRRYLKRAGKSTGQAGETSERSQALYNYKMALKFGDKKAQDRFIAEYAMLGGTMKGLNQSLAYLNPLMGLSKAEEGDFVGSLDPAMRKKFDQAMEFYSTTLMGAAPMK